MDSQVLFAQERVQAILQLLQQEGRVTVEELTQRFQTSATTIRRQLTEMEESGLLRRTHGGAILAKEGGVEHSFDTKLDQQAGEKMRIAAEARKYIHNGDVIMLGGGSTVLTLARLLRDAEDMVVITNSLPTAMELYGNKNISVQFCGGLIRAKTGVAIGASASRFLEDFFAAKTFVGADSISLDFGLTTPNTMEAESEKMLIERGKEVFVLADSTKMNRVSLAQQTILKEIDCIITDDGISKKFAEKLKEKGVQVVLA